MFRPEDPELSVLEFHQSPLRFWVTGDDAYVVPEEVLYMYFMNELALISHQQLPTLNAIFLTQTILLHEIKNKSRPQQSCLSLTLTHPPGDIWN